MRSLNSWIEAQLKKGYRKEQIKRALIKKGYPPKAAAEVDRIRFSTFKASKEVTTGTNRKIPVNALVIFVVIVGIAVGVYYMYGYKAEEVAVSQSEVPRSLNVVGELCKNYPKIEGEIGCEEVVKFVLEKHPGKVEYVKKSEESYPVSAEPLQLTQEEIWVVSMTLDKPFFLRSEETPDYTIEVGVGKYEKSIVLVRDR